MPYKLQYIMKEIPFRGLARTTNWDACLQTVYTNSSRTFLLAVRVDCKVSHFSRCLKCRIRDQADSASGSPEMFLESRAPPRKTRLMIQQQKSSFQDPRVWGVSGDQFCEVLQAALRDICFEGGEGSRDGPSETKQHEAWLSEATGDSTDTTLFLWLPMTI